MSHFLRRARATAIKHLTHKHLETTMNATPKPLPAKAPSAEDLARQLAAPFGPEDIRFFPRVLWPKTDQPNRALVVPYITARAVMTRLDQVFGLGGWSDHYERLPNGSVLCTLKVKIAGRWIQRQDVGGESAQDDEGDRTKAAFSDALKRAAVKFGVGRYLYEVPPAWMPYDPKTKQVIIQKPTANTNNRLTAAPLNGSTTH